MPLPQSTSFRLLALAIITVLGAALFWPSIYKVLYGVLHRHGSSHGVFIPFLAAYFVYLKWDRLKREPIAYAPSAAVALLLLTAASTGTGHFELQFVAFVLFAATAVWFCFGKAIFKQVCFPIVFCITMIPIPGGLYNAIADVTRHITFSLALGVLSLFDIPFYREGWLIKLPNALLEVAKSCSGIRYLISFFVFGIAYAYLFRKKTFARIALVLATIPISLAASTLRLTVIFLATHYISPKMAEHWPHVMLSWMVFFAVLFGLIFLDHYRLNRMRLA